MALYRPPVRLACDTIFTDTCQAVRTFVPILATLTLTAGLLLPAREAERVRRWLGRSAALLQVDTGRESSRPTTPHPVARSRAAAMQEPECDEPMAGPVVPVTPIAHSLESGWWLTPPAGAVVRSQMTRSFCASFDPVDWRLLRDGWSSGGALRARLGFLPAIAGGRGDAVSKMRCAA